MMGYDLYFSGFDIMFNIVFVVVALGFVLVFGLTLVSLFKSAKQRRKNSQSPVLTVDATAVTKRNELARYHHRVGTNHVNHSTVRTTYYVTFEVLSGDRMELEVPDSENGLLAERDTGKLTFQGTHYIAFAWEKELVI